MQNSDTITLHIFTTWEIVHVQKKITVKISLRKIRTTNYVSYKTYTFTESDEIQIL